MRRRVIYPHRDRIRRGRYVFCVLVVRRVECLVLFTPEGELKDLVSICQYLVKGTALAENCTYLEKSKVRHGRSILMS